MPSIIACKVQEWTHYTLRHGILESRMFGAFLLQILRITSLDDSYISIEEGKDLEHVVVFTWNSLNLIKA